MRLLIPAMNVDTGVCCWGQHSPGRVHRVAAQALRAVAPGARGVRALQQRVGRALANFFLLANRHGVDARQQTHGLRGAQRQLELWHLLSEVGKLRRQGLRLRPCLLEFGLAGGGAAAIGGGPGVARVSLLAMRALHHIHVSKAVCSQTRGGPHRRGAAASTLKSLLACQFIWRWRVRAQSHHSQHVRSG